MEMKHTPYDGSAHPFGIGLRPLDLENWIEVDENLPRYLHEKQQLMAAMPAEVWAADFSSESSQQEVLDMVVEHLLAQFPAVYSRSRNIIKIKDIGEIDLDDVTRPPLLTAAFLVQEDLVILRKESKGWHIVAGSVCFPSSWNLRDKIGKVMHDVHGPVPDFHEGTRNAMMIERIFDNLLVNQPVERFNWSVYGDDTLYHGERVQEKIIRDDPANSRFFLRIEHQTLRKLPLTGDILFTIRIHIDPLSALEHRADRAELAGSFLNVIDDMKPEHLAYKRLDQNGDDLRAELIKIRDGQ